MGKRLSRREFVKGAAVATAGAVLSSWGHGLVHQTAQALKAAAAEAVDPDPELQDPEQLARVLRERAKRRVVVEEADELAAEFVEAYAQLDPGRKRWVYDVACAMVADYQQELASSRA